MKLLTPEELETRLKLLNVDDQSLATIGYMFHTLNVVSSRFDLFSLAMTQLLVKHKIEEQTYTYKQLNELKDELQLKKQDLFFEATDEKVTFKIGSFTEQELKGKL